MHATMRKRNESLDKGFTLLELIVAIGIFSFVVIGAVDMMITVFRAQAKAIAIKEVMDNGRFAMELMTRELRTSLNMRFPVPPLPGCPSGLAFTSVNQGVAQERFYYWDGTAIWRVAMGSAGKVNCGLALRLTAPEVAVDHWGARLYGEVVGPNDGQPFITLHLAVRSLDPKWGSDTMIDLQTTVVQRARDLSL